MGAVESKSAPAQKCFIVHSPEDSKGAKTVINDLEDNRNITCVFDGRDFNKTLTFESTITQMMDTCAKVIVIISSKPPKNGWENYKVVKALRKSKWAKKVVCIRLPDVTKEEADKQKQEIVSFEIPHDFCYDNDKIFNWLDIEETSSIYIGQVWSHFTGYAKIVLPELESKIKESKWYKENPDRFPLKEFNLIPESATVYDLKKDDAIKVVGCLGTIKCNRGSYENRQYKVNVYSITKNKETYYFVGHVPNTLGLLGQLEKGTTNLKVKAISSEERIRQVKKYHSLFHQLLNDPAHKSWYKTARLILYDDTKESEGDILMQNIKQTLDGDLEENNPENVPQKRPPDENTKHIYSGLAMAYVKYLCLTLDVHAQTLEKEQKDQSDSVLVYDKLFIVVPKSAASKPLGLLETERSGLSKHKTVAEDRNGRPYQMILYKLSSEAKKDQEYVVAAEYPNAILCLREMEHLDRLSGLSDLDLNTVADNFRKEVNRLITESSLADKAFVLYYDDEKHNTAAAILEVVEEKFSRGDLLEFKRFGGVYSHWGVYAGKDELFHLTSCKVHKEFAAIEIFRRLFDAKVCKEHLKEVTGRTNPIRNNDKDIQWMPSSAETILKRASHMVNIGPQKYSLMTRNCEHFANYCRYGKSESSQIDALLNWLQVQGHYLANIKTLAVVLGILAIALAIATIGYRMKNWS